MLDKNGVGIYYNHITIREKCELLNNLQRNKLIYEYQSGFLPKYSTVHQLLEMYNCILNSLEKKKIRCFVFCDSSIAFDKVWHKGLLHKIKSYDVDSNLLSCFSSYLQDRQQRVVINNSSSSLLKSLYSDTKILSKYIPSLQRR